MPGCPTRLPNSGFSLTNWQMLPYIREWAANGWLNIVGGCCGTTPDYIRGVAEIVKGLPPARSAESSEHSRA